MSILVESEKQSGLFLNSRKNRVSIHTWICPSP